MASYLFVDIETYIDKQNPETGLNPYLPNSKIITIAFNYYDAFVLTERNIIPPTIYREWESSEKEILEKFYNFVKRKVEISPHIKIVGFNHIKFDLPYLFARLAHYEVDEKENIHKILFQSPHHIDLGQVSMITSSRMKKRKEFYNVGQREVNKFFNIPIKTEDGKKLSEYYCNKQFKKIIDYIKKEFKFELLYINLRRHIHIKKTMDPS